MLPIWFWNSFWKFFEMKSKCKYTFEFKILIMPLNKSFKNNTLKKEWEGSINLPVEGLGVLILYIMDAAHELICVIYYQLLLAWTNYIAYWVGGWLNVWQSKTLWIYNCLQLYMLRACARVYMCKKKKKRVHANTVESRFLRLRDIGKMASFPQLVYNHFIIFQKKKKKELHIRWRFIWWFLVIFRPLSF